MDKGDTVLDDQLHNKISDLSLISKKSQLLAHSFLDSNNIHSALDIDDENDLTFAKLLKRELSKKKIQEHGTKTEQYKETYFKQIEINNILNQNINDLKTKIKQYKHQLQTINEKHNNEVNIYTKQIDELRSTINHEKALLDEEQSDILLIRNNNREMQMRIDVLDGEIQKIIKMRKSNESEMNYKDNEIALLNKKNHSIKQDIVQIQKDLTKVNDDAKRLHQTKFKYEQKIDLFHTKIEEVQKAYDNLLYEIECTQLENVSYQKVLKAHENICLELLKIAAEKLDSHNDEHVLEQITDIMKKLDENKKKYERELKKIAITKHHIKSRENQMDLNEKKIGIKELNDESENEDETFEEAQEHLKN